MRRPWGLRIRVLAAAGTIALVSAITFGLLLNALLDQQRAAGPARNVTEARNAINAIQRLSQDLETGARGFLLTQDRSFLDPYTAARRELPRQLAALAAVPNDADQRARTAELRRELAAYTSYLEDVIGRADASAVTAQEGRRQFDAIRATVTELDASERRELLQRRAQSADLRERSIVVAGLGLAVLLLLIALISYGAVRGVVIPVDRLQGFARELGARRYGARLPESGPPETVELAQAFNTTAAKLAASEAELRRVGERHLAELDAVFAEAPLGLAFVDQELRYLRVNDALAEMNGLTAGALVGKRVRQPDAVAALERVLATGEPVLNVEVAVEGRRFEASYFPVRAGGDAPVAVGAAVSDVEARRRAEDARERLQHATATLAATVTVADVAETAVAETRATFDSDGAALLLVRGDWLELTAIDGLNAEKHGRLSQVPLTARRPSAEAARTGRPVHVQTPAQMAERFPELVDVPALVTFPLITAGEPLGVLLIDFKAPAQPRRGRTRPARGARDPVRDRARPRPALRARARRRADAAGLAAPAQGARRSRAWTSRPSSWPARRGSTSAATSTTRSRSRRASGGSRSATCAARAWTRRPSPPSPATRCAPRPSRARRRATSCAP